MHFTSHSRVLNKFCNCSHMEGISIWYSRSAISTKECQEEGIEWLSSTWLSIMDFFQNGWVSQGFLLKRKLAASESKICERILECYGSNCLVWPSRKHVLMAGLVSPSLIFRILQCGFFTTSVRVYFMQKTDGKHIWFWSMHLSISISISSINGVFTKYKTRWGANVIFQLVDIIRTIGWYTKTAIGLIQIEDLISVSFLSCQH